MFLLLPSSRSSLPSPSLPCGDSAMDGIMFSSSSSLSNRGLDKKDILAPDFIAIVLFLDFPPESPNIGFIKSMLCLEFGSDLLDPWLTAEYWAELGAALLSLFLFCLTYTKASPIMQQTAAPTMPPTMTMETEAVETSPSASPVSDSSFPPSVSSTSEDVVSLPSCDWPSSESCPSPSELESSSSVTTPDPSVEFEAGGGGGGDSCSHPLVVQDWKSCV
mmetsp:Transcript_3019/g.8175  ORF Transcript_3019/g.8175 Transcript_3019/m.8175 type:complete len:219 (+) Transcript_3019:618-1274(+)